MRVVGVEAAVELAEIACDGEPSPRVQSVLRGIEGRLAGGWRAPSGGACSRGSCGPRSSHPTAATAPTDTTAQPTRPASGSGTGRSHHLGPILGRASVSGRRWSRCPPRRLGRRWSQSPGWSADHRRRLGVWRRVVSPRGGTVQDRASSAKPSWKRSEAATARPSEGVCSRGQQRVARGHCAREAGAGKAPAPHIAGIIDRLHIPRQGECSPMRPNRQQGRVGQSAAGPHRDNRRWLRGLTSGQPGISRTRRRWRRVSGRTDCWSHPWRRLKSVTPGVLALGGPSCRCSAAVAGLLR